MPFAADSIWFTATSTGTGSFVVASAVPGYRTPAQAAVPNGSTIHYSARTATEFENGEGVYTSGTVTLTRVTIFASSNANAVVDFLAVPTVAISPLAEDAIFPPASSTDNAIVLWDGTAGDTVKNSAMTVSGAGALSGTNTGDQTLASLGAAASARILTAGAGLTGGGDLTADRTFAVGAGTGITVNADDVALTVPVAVASGGTGQTTEAEAIGEMIQALTADATPDYAADYFATYDASADTGKKLLMSVAVREKLFAARTYFVRSGGSDSNDGLTSGTAFLTVQKAVNVINTLDCAGFAVTIDVAEAATFSGGISALQAPISASGGFISIVGLNTTGSTILTNAGSHTITVGSGGYFNLQNVEVRCGAAGAAAINAITRGNINISSGVRFGTLGSSGKHFNLDIGGVVYADTAYVIVGSGTSAYHIYNGGGYFEQFAAHTLSGTLTFGTFAECFAGGYITGNNAYTGGTITAKRYNVTLNGVINVGGSATYYPGATVGTTATGGQYV